MLSNLEFLDSSMAIATKFRRKHPIMTAPELQEFTLRNQKAQYKIVKCEPKICKLIRKMHLQTLDPREYPYMGDQPEKKRKAGEDFVSRGAKNIKGGGRLD